MAVILVDFYFEIALIGNSSFAAIVAYGILCGLLISPITLKLHKCMFSGILKTIRYDKRLCKVFNRKFRAYLRRIGDPKQFSFLSYKQVLECVWANYSDKYNSGALFSFRMPKTFAVMHFNLTVVFLTFAITGTVKAYQQEFYVESLAGSIYQDTLIFCFLAFLSFYESRSKFSYSLEKELEYWQGKDIDDLGKLVFNVHCRHCQQFSHFRSKPVREQSQP